MGFIRSPWERVREYSSYSLVEWFISATVDKNAPMAKYLFSRIENIEAIGTHNFITEGLPWFVGELIKSRDINSEGLKKVYYLCFYSSMLFDTQELVDILKQTYDNPNLPIEYIYDCMVRCPGIYILEFYKLLLELILERDGKIRIRKNIIITLERIIEFIGNKSEIDQEDMDLSLEVRELIEEMRKRDLIYGDLLFDEKELKELVDLHLNNSLTQDDYISNINKLYEFH